MNQRNHKVTDGPILTDKLVVVGGGGDRDEDGDGDGGGGFHILILELWVLDSLSSIRVSDIHQQCLKKHQRFKPSVVP